MASAGSKVISEIDAPAEAASTEPRISELGDGRLRAIWDSGDMQALVQFYPKGDGVVLEFIKVRPGGHSFGGALFAAALRAAGIPQPKFVESSPVIHPTLLKLIQSGSASDLALAQRFWRIQSLAFAKEIGATVKSTGLVKNQRGNWIAAGQLSYD